jgi:micrococcal nuclease
MPRTIAVACVLLVMCGCAQQHASKPEGAATVERIVDGDTLVADLGGTSEKVRLIGVDTPESVKPNTPVQCFAKEASAHLAQLLPVGSAIRLERDVEARDRYDRLLAYVYRADDDLFVNLELAEEGYANPLTIPPNVAHANDFVAAAGRARESAKGLWSACDG